MRKMIPIICMPLGAAMVMGYFYFATKMEIPMDTARIILEIATMLMMTGVIFITVDIAEKYRTDKPDAYTKKKK